MYSNKFILNPFKIFSELFPRFYLGVKHDTKLVVKFKICVASYKNFLYSMYIIFLQNLGIFRRILIFCIYLYNVYILNVMTFSYHV